MINGWIDSVYFKTLHIRYSVLNRGYIGNPAGHKLRAVIKEIIQSRSPCIDQRHMVCSECSRKEDCIFFHLVVEQGEFGAYIVQVDDHLKWRGQMEPGMEQGLDIHLIGNKSGLAGQISECLRCKPFFSFDAAGNERVRFALVSVKDKHEGRKTGVKEIIEGYRNREKWDGGAVSGICIEFVTPVEIRRKGRIIDNPKDMTFNVYLSALIERIRGLAKVHCGFKGEMPFFEDTASAGREMRTDSSALVFVSRKPRGKNKEFAGGLKGQLLFWGDLIPYFPMILLGEALHIGKKTTQGLGRYRIVDIYSASTAVS